MHKCHWETLTLLFVTLHHKTNKKSHTMVTLFYAILRLKVCDLGQHGWFLVFDIFWRAILFLYYKRIWRVNHVVFFAVFLDHYFCGLTLFAIINYVAFYFLITWIIWTLIFFLKSRLMHWKFEEVLYRIHFISAPKFQDNLIIASQCTLQYPPKDRI